MRVIHPIIWALAALFAATLLECTPASTPMTAEPPAAQVMLAPSYTVTPQPPSPTSTSSAVATTPAPTPTAETITATPGLGVDLSLFAYVYKMGRLSPTQGWVLTDSLSECGADPGCRIRLVAANDAAPVVKLLWTEDAGESWSDITPAGLSNCPPQDICTIDAPPILLDSSRIGIVVVRGQELMPPTTLSYMYTENGGKTWGLWNIIDELEYGRTCPGHGCLSDVNLEFADPLNGWLSASASLGMHTEALYLYRTEDGGQSWSTLVKTSTGDSGGPGWKPTPIIHQLNFTSPSTGWAVAGWRWDTGTMLATYDGASSWWPVNLYVPESYAEMGRDHLAPIFFTRDSGVLPVRFYHRDDSGHLLGFYTTWDGGETWSLTSTLEGSDTDTFGSDQDIAWSAINETTWFVAFSDSSQYFTYDRGRTWEVFAAEGLGDFDLVETQFVSVTDGWGLAKICESDVGCVNTLFATHDGGHSWSPIGLSP